MPLWAPRTRRTKGDLGAGWRKLTVSQGISSPTARQAPRRSPRAASARETLPTASPPTPSKAAARHSTSGRGGPWRCCCPTAGSAFPTRSWGSPRTTRPRARAQSSPSWSGGSWASVAYRPDQAWRSSRLLENLAISRQLTSSDDPWETLAGGHFDASFSNAAR